MVGVKVPVLVFLLIFISSVEAQGIVLEPYLIINGEPLSNNSFIDANHIINLVPIECRVSGVTGRLEDDDDDGDRSIFANWYDPRYRRISQNTKNVRADYRGSGVLLEVQSNIINQGLYRCVSSIGRHGEPVGVAYVGLYLSGGENVYYNACSN